MNRIIQWEDTTIICEADTRHAEIIIKQMGMKGNSRPVATPGHNEKEEEGDDEELDTERATTYRALVARANYLAQDRTDIGYTAKELCRRMSAPRERDWRRLKRLTRYRIGREREQ